MGLGKVIADISVDTQNMKRSFGMEGSLTNFVNIHEDSIEVTSPYVVESTRTLGSSFILGHATHGVIGSTNYIGDNRSLWTQMRISSPNNTFVETFDGSRFINFSSSLAVLINTDDGDIKADDYVYYPYTSWVSIDISAFSGKTIDAASFFMKPDIVLSPAPVTLDFWDVKIGSEYTEAATASTLGAYTTGAKVALTNPWANMGVYAGVNIKNVFDVPHNAGSNYMVFKMRASYLTTDGNTKGGANAIRMGSYPVLGGSFVSCYDRTNTLNYPYLQVKYTESASGMTGNWGSGSVYLVDGNQFETKSIYIGSQPLSNIKLNLTGSTYDHLYIQATPNGVNWENCNSASVAKYNFNFTGSDLRLRLTASGGNTILTRYECAYGLY